MLYVRMEQILFSVFPEPGEARTILQLIYVEIIAASDLRC